MGVSLCGARRFGLDGAPLLHRRTHAERGSAAQLPARPEVGGKLAGRGRALSTHGGGVARQSGPKYAPRQAAAGCDLWPQRSAALAVVLAGVFHGLRRTLGLPWRS